MAVNKSILPPESYLPISASLSHSSTTPPHPHILAHIQRCSLCTSLTYPLLPFSLVRIHFSAFPTHSSIMDKNLTADQLLACAEANGYRRGAHHKEDGLRDRNKHRQDRYVLSGD